MTIHKKVYGCYRQNKEDAIEKALNAHRRDISGDQGNLVHGGKIFQVSFSACLLLYYTGW